MPNRPPTHAQLTRPHAKAEAHARYDAKRKDAVATRIRSGARWKAVSALFKARNAVCCDPLALHVGRVVATSQAHHIVGLERDASYQNAYSFDALAPLCDACHSAVEQRERKGEDTSAMVRRAKEGMAR